MTDFYGWCDIGYFRNNPNNTHTRFLNNWPNNNILIKPQFNNTLIHYGLVQNDTTIFNNLKEEIKNHYINELKNPPIFVNSRVLNFQHPSKLLFHLYIPKMYCI